LTFISLKRCSQINSHTVYPWILNFCNNVTNDDQLHAVQFPDVNTASLPPNSRFSMSAGDFLQVYNEPSSFICIIIYQLSKMDFLFR